MNFRGDWIWGGGCTKHACNQTLTLLKAQNPKKQKENTKLLNKSKKSNETCEEAQLLLTNTLEYHEVH